MRKQLLKTPIKRASVIETARFFMHNKNQAFLQIYANPDGIKMNKLLSICFALIVTNLFMAPAKAKPPAKCYDLYTEAKRS